MRTKDIEQQWRSSLRTTDQQLMDTFPDADQILTNQLERLNDRVDILQVLIRLKRKIVRFKTQDEFTLWFYDQLLDVDHGVELRSVQKQISRIKRYLHILAGVPIPGGITDESITQAKEYPIEQLIDQPLRRSGQRLTGLCPLHDDRSPSFVIYKDTNTAWCFGCQQGGDTIKLAQLLHGYSFKEAVKFLNH